MADPWLRQYPKGVRWDVPLPQTPLHELVDAAARRYPTNPALEFAGRVIDYAEFSRLVDRTAAGLQELGVGPGVHVGLYLPNSLHYPISFFAVLKAGGTVVNYSPLDTERVLAHKVENSETDFIITLDARSLYPQMERLLRSTRLKKLIVGTIYQFSDDGGAGTLGLVEAGLLSPVPFDDKHVSFASVLASERSVIQHTIKDLHDALAVLQYTGGTTGEPKGAMLTHGSLSACVGQFFEFSQGAKPTLHEGRERVLVTLPFFHIYAITVCLLLSVRLAAHMVICPKFDVDEALAMIPSKKITVFPGVPTMYTSIVNHPKVNLADLRSLGFCASGGAPLPMEIRQRFFEITGAGICDGWGMTETGPGTLSPSSPLMKPNSCGIPAPSVRLKIIALDGSEAEVPAGSSGELCLAGPNLMKGYWKNPAATANSMTTDGFFRTGDVAVMDEAGFFFIVDRTKDMLLCGGYNVYPRVIEEAIYEHPDVEEACVIGVNDEYRGQSPKAFIKLKAGAQPMSLADLQAFLKTRVGKHEMVQALEVRPELPKTPVGKLSKLDLVREEQAAAARPNPVLVRA